MTSGHPVVNEQFLGRCSSGLVAQGVLERCSCIAAEGHTAYAFASNDKIRGGRVILDLDASVGMSCGG